MGLAQPVRENVTKTYGYCAFVSAVADKIATLDEMKRGRLLCVLANVILKFSRLNLIILSLS